MSPSVHVFRFISQKLPPLRKNKRQTAGRNTYELIMEVAAAAGRDDAVLAQADAARSAFGAPEAAVDSSDSHSDNFSDKELSPGALAHEVAAAGRLGQWDRVSPVMSKALRSPSLRGIAGARLYAALISAAAACGRPQRGLEVFREMEADVDRATKGGGGNDAEGNGRLPPPDYATFLAALDACEAVAGQESIALAIGVTKAAAAATGRTEGAGSSGTVRAILSNRKLASVLARAGEVCGAAGAVSTAAALAAKAVEIGAMDVNPGGNTGGSSDNVLIEEGMFPE